MRVFDVAAALLGMILLAPVMLLAAVSIRLLSPGKVFFGQTRIGLNGKPFTLWKFRSMVPGAERRGSTVTTRRDRRITPIGRILRGAKIDELPQLWNVLRGDMSLVGPRPDTPEIVEGYSAEMRRILGIRPGLTSLATLHLRNEERLLDEALNPDLAYRTIFVPAKIGLAMEHVRRKSFAFDFKILLLTAWALTGGRILPMREHPVTAGIRKAVLALNAGTEDGAVPADGDGEGTGDGKARSENWL